MGVAHALNGKMCYYPLKLLSIKPSQRCLGALGSELKDK